MKDLISENTKNFLSEILQCDASDIGVNTSFKNHPNWDSFTHVEVMMLLDEKFSIDFCEDNFNKFGQAREVDKLFNKDT